MFCMKTAHLAKRVRLTSVGTVSDKGQGAARA